MTRVTWWCSPISHHSSGYPKNVLMTVYEKHRGHTQLCNHYQYSSFHVCWHSKGGHMAKPRIRVEDWKTINTRPNHSTNKIKRWRETEMRLKRRDESRWKACKSRLRVGWNVTSRDRCVRTPDPTRGPASLAAAPTTRTTHVHLCDSRSPCLRWAPWGAGYACLGTWFKNPHCLVSIWPPWVFTKEMWIFFFFFNLEQSPWSVPSCFYNIERRTIFLGQSTAFEKITFVASPCSVTWL